MDRVVTFVCLHGAGKSRVAAALFNVDPPAGWRAESAGLEPQEEPSPHVAALLAGDPAAAVIDDSVPRRLSSRADVVVAIDCVVGEADRWDLDDKWPSPGVVEQLRTLARELAARLGQRANGS